MTSRSDLLESLTDDATRLVYSPLSRKRTIRTILSTTLSNAATMVLTFMTEVVNTLCISRTGNDDAVAAIGLGNAMQNCVCLSIAMGLTAALDTFVSQAHGTKNHELAVVALQRTRVLVSCQLFWMIPILWCSYQWFQCMHENLEVSRLASTYNRSAIGGYFFWMQYEASQVFLRNVGAAHVPATILSVTTLTHIPLCIFFVNLMGLGNQGAGLANAVTWSAQCVLAFGYIIINAPVLGVARKSFLKIPRSVWQGWGQYCQVSFPTMFQLCSDWWFFEFLAIIVGWLGPEAQAAHNATTNIVSLCLMPAFGHGFSAAFLVGNALGEGNASEAQQFAWLCVCVAGLYWLATGFILYCARFQLAALYMPDEEERERMRVIICIAVVYGFFMSVESAFAGVMRGIDKCAVSARIYLISNWIIGIPCTLLFGFGLKGGIAGVWCAMAIGPAGATLCFIWFLRQASFHDLATHVARATHAAMSAVDGN